MAVFPSFIFDTSKGETPQSVAMKRALAAQIMGGMGNRPARNVGEGIGNAFASLGQGITANVMNRRAAAGEDAGQAAAGDLRQNLIDYMTKGSSFPAAPNPGNSTSMASMPAPDYASARVAQAHYNDGPLPSSFLSAVDRHEGAGGYDTLFGHAQRGPFAGTDVSQMTVGDALAFASPSGAYGQHVKGQIGRVATPMGRHQIVGTTLRNAAQEMGLDPSTPFNAQTQDAIAAHLARSRIASANTMDGKISALRSEWEGFKSVPRAQMEQIVRDLEAGASPQVASGGLTPEALQAWGANAYAPARSGSALDAVNNLAANQPVPVAETEADIIAQEQAMMGQDPQAFQQPGGGPPVPQEYADMGLSGDSWARMNAPDGAVPPMPAPQTIQDRPIAQPQPMEQPFARNEMSGRVDRQPQMDMGLLMQVLSNPFMDEGTKAFAQAQLQQYMQAQDPAHQLDMRYRQAQIDKMQREADGLGEAAKVQSSVVLDDGSTVMVMNNGQRRVLSPTGEEVTGQAAADAIRSAREYTVRNQQDIYSGRRSGTLTADAELGAAASGAKKSGEKTMEAGFSAWEDYGKLQSSLGNINEAIAAIDSGAKSGIVYNMLPNVTEASASLQNAMDRMGLDVIGSVTFGALSEGEMRLAMETAVPRSLQPAELRNWLVRKRDAQQKASAMLADAAQFLTVPGNTINDWIAKNRAAKGGASGQAPSQSSSTGPQRLRFNPETGELE